MNLRDKTLLIGVLCIMLTTSVMQPAVNAENGRKNDVELTSSFSTGITFEVSVPWKSSKIDPVRVDGIDYTLITIPGWVNNSLEGAPKLPYITQALGVPFGVDLEISVSAGQVHTYQLDAPVLPAATQKVETDPSYAIESLLNPTPSIIQVIETDPAIYDGQQVYPRQLAEISNEGIMRQQRIAGISVYPVQFDPQNNTLIIYESLKVEVSFIGEIPAKRLGKTYDADAYEMLFRENLLNYESALQWRQDVVETGDVTRGLEDRGTPWQPPEPAWRISVEQDGFFKLTYAELLLAGLPLDMVDAPDPQTFQIFYQGQEIAIQVVGEEDQHFDPEDTILFYGQGIESKYTKENVYWLTYGHGAGARMDAPWDGTPLGENLATHFISELHLEDNLVYISSIPGTDKLERLIWAQILTTNPSLNPWNYQFIISEPYTTMARLKVMLLGGTQNLSYNPDHHAKISLNGSEVASVKWDGVNFFLVDVDIDTSLLVAGTNILTVFLPNDTGAPFDYVCVDWVELTYSNSFQVNPGENTLVFGYDTVGTWKFQVSGFTSDNLLVYDVTDPLNVRGVDNFSETEDGLVFEHTLSGAKEFWVGADTSIQTIPASRIVEDTPSNLQSSMNAAEYIVITHQTFKTEAGILVDHRVAQGLSSMLVDIQDVYDEFSYGVVSVEAIQDFLAYAYTNWLAPTPVYVVLVGDGHYDPKKHLSGTSKTSFIPPYLGMYDPWSGETAADNRYVTFLGNDNLPDLLLGRLSVNTPAEAAAFIAKITYYESHPLVETWSREILAVAGAADSAGDFAQISDDLIAQTLPTPYAASKIYYKVTHTDINQAVAALKNGINEGKLVVNFVGHGFSTGWSAQKNPINNFLRTTDVPALTNTGKYPIILAMTCSEGAFQSPGTEAMGEVITRAKDKGAVASWSPTGLGVSGAHDLMNRGFFIAMFNNGAETLGEAVQAGLFNLWVSGSSLYLLDTYELFGDPALMLPRSQIAVDDQYETAEDQMLSVDTEDGVLKNDFGIENKLLLNAILNTGTVYGTLNLVADGSFTYEPGDEWSGEDGFTYDLYDGEALIGTATVTITVSSVNDAPAAHAQSVETQVNVPIAVTLTGSDIEGDPLKYYIYDQPSHGTIRENIIRTRLSGANWIYTPDENYCGSDSFTFFVNDGVNNSEKATISIVVYCQIYLPLIQK